MKFGTIWFLHLDALIQSARIAVILCFIVGFVTQIGSILFLLSWILFAIFLVITVCTCFMHIPSGKKVEKFISQYETDFLEKQKTEFRNCERVKITALRCFSNDARWNMSRWIGSKKIYSTLVMLAWVETKEDLWLIHDEKSLSTNQPNVTSRYKINDIGNVKVEKDTPDADGEVRWRLTVEDVTYQFVCKEDYHFRDFLNRLPQA